MKYPRKLMSQKQIEITSKCNLACVYCPHSKMSRPKIDMTWEIFERSMEWAAHYRKQGTQKELSFTGIGESTLHPRFGEMLAYARKTLPESDIIFSTNGLPSFTEAIAKTCADNHVGVFISLHRPELAAKTVNLCRKYGILRQAHANFATNSINWAGTVDWPVSAHRSICEFLRQGWGVILSDGSISTCCYDNSAPGEEKSGVVAHVSGPIGEAYVKPYALCAGCEQVAPPETE